MISEYRVCWDAHFLSVSVMFLLFVRICWFSFYYFASANLTVTDFRLGLDEVSTSTYVNAEHCGFVLGVNLSKTVKSDYGGPMVIQDFRSEIAHVHTCLPGWESKNICIDYFPHKSCLFHSECWSLITPGGKWTLEEQPPGPCPNQIHTNNMDMTDVSWPSAHSACMCWTSSIVDMLLGFTAIALLSFLSRLELEICCASLQTKYREQILPPFYANY